jgi:hypothetical protein
VELQVERARARPMGAFPWLPCIHLRLGGPSPPHQKRPPPTPTPTQANFEAPGPYLPAHPQKPAPPACPSSSEQLGPRPSPTGSCTARAGGPIDMLREAAQEK